MQKPQQRPLKIVYGQINNGNINVLRKVNFQVFPVKYSTSFYIKLLAEYTQLSRFVYYNDIVIGAYTVRIEDYQQKKHAYILTFGVLQPYRKYGIGRKMMENLEADLKRTHKQVYGIYLHMHVLNVGGKQFYEKCGFTVNQKLQNYYTDLEQPHCYVLRKVIQQQQQV